jgi:hypothetical protein
LTGAPDIKNYTARQAAEKLLHFTSTNGETMPFQFGEHFEGYGDVGCTRRKKQERRFRELHFLFKTAPAFMTKLYAALELDSLCDEMGMGEDLLSELEAEPANDA